MALVDVAPPVGTCSEPRGGGGAGFDAKSIDEPSLEQGAAPLLLDLAHLWNPQVNKTHYAPDQSCLVRNQITSPVQHRLHTQVVLCTRPGERSGQEKVWVLWSNDMSGPTHGVDDGSTFALARMALSSEACQTTCGQQNTLISPAGRPPSGIRGSGGLISTQLTVSTSSGKQTELRLELPAWGFHEAFPGQGDLGFAWYSGPCLKDVSTFPKV